MYLKVGFDGYRYVRMIPGTAHRHHLQPGCNEIESTCLVCSFDVKATVKRMVAVLALPWIEISKSVLSIQGKGRSFEVCVQAKGLVTTYVC